MSALQFQSHRTHSFSTILNAVAVVSSVLALTACGTREPETDPARLSQMTTNPPAETQTPGAQPTPNLIPAVESTSQITRPTQQTTTGTPRVNVLVGYTETSSTAARRGSDRTVVIPAGSPLYAFPSGTDGYLLSSDTRYRDRNSGISYLASEGNSEIYLVHVQGGDEVCGNHFDDNGNGNIDEGCPGASSSSNGSTVTISNAVGTPVGGTASGQTAIDCTPFGQVAQPSGTVVSNPFIGVASGSFVGTTSREEGVIYNGYNYTVPAGSQVFVVTASFNGYALAEGTQISSETYGSFRVPSVSSSNSRYVVKIQGAPEICGNLFDDNANGTRDEACSTIVVR